MLHDIDLVKGQDLPSKKNGNEVNWPGLSITC